MRALSRSKRPDTLLMISIGLLVVLGVIIMASASPVVSSVKFDDMYYFFTHQVLYGVGVGIVAFFITLHVRYTAWRRLALPIFIASIALMILAIIPHTGLTLKGASRWISLGPITIQPGEIIKFSFILYLSSWIATHKRELSGVTSGFIPFLVMLGIVAGLFILQKDLGTFAVLAASATLLFFLSGARMRQIGILFIIGIIGLGAFAYLEPYRIDRLKVFLNPETDKQGAGYQINQALIAIGSGGAFGRGFGLSRQKFQHLPEAIGDSIFAVYGEEFGFIGSLALITLFLLFFWRGFRTSFRAPDAFGKALAAGITLLVITQAFVNIGAMSGLLPLTGIPLSFISYGSSALIMNLAFVGILANISKYAS